MKKIIMLMTMSTLTISCGPSISDVAQKKLDKKVEKKSLSYYTVKDGKLKLSYLKPFKSELVEEIDLTQEEKDKITQSITAAASMGAKGYDLEFNKYKLQLSYNSPNDGFVSVNDELYSSKEAMEIAKKSLVFSKTHKSVCAKRGHYGYGCAKYKKVKIDGAKQIEEKINQEFANFKVLKKDAIVLTKNYIAGVSEESAGGRSMARVKIKNMPKRDTASVK